MRQVRRLLGPKMSAMSKRFGTLTHVVTWEGDDLGGLDD